MAGRICDDIVSMIERHLHERQHTFGRSLFDCSIDGWIDLSVHFSGDPFVQQHLSLGPVRGFGVGAFDAIPIDVFFSFECTYLFG